VRRCFLALCAVLAVGITAVSLAATNATVTSNEPQPGGTINASTQPIGSSGKVQVVVKGGLAKTTLVAEGGLERSGSAQGSAVAACWLAGPGAIPVTNARVKSILENDPDIQQSYDGASRNPQLTLALCMSLVAAVGENLANERRAVTAATGCSLKPLKLRFRRRNGATVATLAKKTGLDTRYSCSKVRGGLKLTARGGGKPLSGEVGSTIGLGLYKTTDGPPSSGKLTFKFGLR
jgi:hypothetical protein